MAAPNGVTLGTPCVKCGDVLTENNYVSTSRGNIKAECRNCKNAYSREWRKKNPEHHLNYDLKELYGISLETYREMEKFQLGGCAICKQPCESGHRLSVDHDHRTGLVRDLLCKRCNVIIGLCNEDELLLFSIMDYLKRHSMWKAS